MADNDIAVLEKLKAENAKALKQLGKIKTNNPELTSEIDSLVEKLEDKQVQIACELKDLYEEAVAIAEAVALGYIDD